MWPIKYRSFTMLNRMKYIQATVLPVCLVLPILSVVGIQLSGGYGLNIFTHYVCRSKKVNNVFYAVVLPLDVMLVTGTSLLIIIAWNIIDVVSPEYWKIIGFHEIIYNFFPNIIYLSIQKRMCKGKAKYKKRRQTTTNVKVIITILYYFFFSCYNIAIAATTLVKSEAFADELKKYFACVALGEGVCTKVGFNKFRDDALLYTIFNLWLAFYPSVFFIYLISFKKCKELWKKSTHSHPSRISALTTSTSIHSLNHVTNTCALKSSTSLANIARPSSRPLVNLARSRSFDTIA